MVTICTAQWSLYVPSSGHYMYRTVVTICTASLTLTNSTFYPHSLFMCFVWISEQRAIISLYSINWLVFITETECVYCVVRTGSLYIIPRSAHTAVFICFVWISEQTAFISPYNINWLICITETECVYCAVRTEFSNKIYVNVFFIGRDMGQAVIPRAVTPHFPNTHAHLHPHAALTRRTKGSSLGTWK